MGQYETLSAEGCIKACDPAKCNSLLFENCMSIVLNMLAEVTTTTISKTESPQNMDENIAAARRGGRVAKTARSSFEKETGQNVVSELNAKNKLQLEIKNPKDSE
jgi:hypothetical protein